MGRSQNITKEHTEEAFGRPWVLKPEFRTLNLWDPDWWALIRNREHRRSRALTSSQCFAVNLFAPLAVDRALARRALLSLLPHRVLAATDTVEVALEFTPPNGAEVAGGAPATADPD